MRQLHTEGVPVHPAAPLGREDHRVPDAWLVPGWAPPPPPDRSGLRTALATPRRAYNDALARREWGLARDCQREMIRIRRDWRPATS